MRMRIEGAPDLNLKSVTVCIVESQVIKDMILSLILNQSTRPERLILCLYALFFFGIVFLISNGLNELKWLRYEPTGQEKVRYDM